MAYVIKSWRVNNNPADTSKTFVNIAIRESGLISWLLSLMKIDPTIILKVTDQHFIFEEGSFSGSTQRIIPLQNISSSYYGYSKPWKAAIVVGIITGLLTFFFLFIPGIIIGMLYYFLNKSLMLGVGDIGGRDFSIQFKRSLIENQEIDETQAMEVRNLIQKLIDSRLKP